MLLSLMLVLTAPALAVDGYGSARWGMTVEQVGKLVPGLGECSAFSTMVARCAAVEVLGTKGEVSYQFDGGKLARVKLVFPTAPLDFATEVGKVLEQKYGESSLSKGPGTLTSTWTTEGVSFVFDAAVPPASLVVTYDAKAAEAGKAALAAL